MLVMPRYVQWLETQAVAKTASLMPYSTLAIGCPPSLLHLVVYILRT
jgi:hypothetical protein